MRHHDNPTARGFPRRRYATRLACAFVSTLCSLTAACGSSAKTEGTDAAAKASTDAAAMADMPGMSAPNDQQASPGETSASSSTERIALTASQVKNGRVQWAPAVLGAAAAVATVPGQLVPNEDRTTRLGAPASGRVVAVRVRPGDRVSAGQLLATLQSPDAGAAQADVVKGDAEVSARRAQAAYAKAARERAERLLALKAIPRQDYERAIADDELARAALAQAEAELRRAQSTAAQLGSNASTAGEIAVRAPFAGVVLERTAVPGAVVEPGAPLIVITEPSSLWLSIDAPEGLSARFRVGAKVDFTVPAYGAEHFSARIEAVGAGLSAQRRTLPVRALVANASGRLKPEMLATVVVAGPGSVSAVLLPDDAVQFLDGKTVAFIARPDVGGGATFTAREVGAGSRSGGRIAVVRGLAPGELVVTHGAFAVKSQLKKSSMPEMDM